MSSLAETPTRYTGKGRVLRVKEGYNPNSSSLGSIVFSIHAATLAAPILLAGAAAWIAARMAGGATAAHPAAETPSSEERP